MREVLRKIIGTMKISNRPAHILCVCLMSLLLGWSAGVASIISLEYKDVQRGGWKCWDWFDCLAGLIGCIVGGSVHYYLFRHW